MHRDRETTLCPSLLLSRGGLAGQKLGKRYCVSKPYGEALPSPLVAFSAFALRSAQGFFSSLGLSKSAAV